MNEWLMPPPGDVLVGEEQFIGIDASVTDFWAFAMSDLRTNNVRGYLAEFIVARAVGATARRVEWDEFDVVSSDGVTIEVKSSAHLQVWEQRQLSKIVFTGLTGRTWTPRSGHASAATYNAEVYVFCVQTAQSHDTYDPLDVRQWTFYVLPRTTLADLGQKSLSLAALLKLARPIAYGDLAAEVSRVGRET